MASATTIRAAATANVIRNPVATASGRAVVMSVVADASANRAPMTDAPVMSPRITGSIFKASKNPVSTRLRATDLDGIRRADSTDESLSQGVTSIGPKADGMDRRIC